MLTILDDRSSTSCDGTSRRDFLRVGALGLGGLSLPWLLKTEAAFAAAGKPHYVRKKSVILIYLGGGASHIETFNPNMHAPSPHHSVNGELKTSLSGVTFGAMFPRLAKRAKQLAVVRSFQHGVGDHTRAMSHMLTGGTDPNGGGTDGFSMGSLYSRVAGMNDPRTGMPSYSVLVTKEIDGPGMRQQARFLKGSRPGTLGPAYAPFDPLGEGPLRSNMTLKMPAKRMDDRLALCRQLDRLRGEIDRSGVMDSVDRFRRQAYDVIHGSVANALDVSGENPKVIAQYDTSDFKVGYEKFRPSTLGKRLLIARRLCEAGCGFVTVHFDGWDNHGGNRPGIVGGMKIHGPPLDKAMSALLDDLQDRGLFDDVLVVLTGDFGRTPKINGKGGRDHWPRLSTLALAGGGLPAGVVIGRSDRQNAEPATEPVTLSQLMGTITRTLFDVGELRLDTGLPRDLSTLIQNSLPIPGLT